MYGILVGMSYKKEDLDEVTNENAPGCAPARAKQLLWSPWGKLPPRGGGGLPQGGDDDEDESMKIRVIIRFRNRKYLNKRVMCPLKQRLSLTRPTL